jgi:uncharacterized protein (TIGR02145 family)
MQNKDLHNFLSLNTDDRPEDLQPGDITDALNFRLGSSKDQHGIGIAETLQSEVEVLIGVAAAITYYGEAIGGEFIYEGFEEIQIGSKVVMKKNWDGVYPGSKVYNDDEANASIYGRLYTHNQIMQADFCPAGWHIPTEAEFDEILTELGGEMLAGGKMKEVGMDHWLTPNTGASDSRGFRAIPGGKFDLLFELLGYNSILWLQDEAVPVAPVASSATQVLFTSFMANWILDVGSDGYYLDVATDSAFTAFVAGYNNKDVGKVFSYNVTGISASTNYFYRIRAYNEIGSSDNSNTIPLSTGIDNRIIDLDGNVYDILRIGTKEWTIQNLKTTKYADGTPIPNITDIGDWIADVTGAYCYYNNDIAYKSEYGALYNWYAVDNIHNLVDGQFTQGGVPSIGWRVPLASDFDELISDFGGEGSAGIAGAAMKETGLSHWLPPNDVIATNISGFSARGAGSRDLLFGSFSDIKGFCGFLSNTPISADDVYYYDLDSGNEHVFKSYYMGKHGGLSVRCVRDVV